MSAAHQRMNQIVVVEEKPDEKGTTTLTIIHRDWLIPNSHRFWYPTNCITFTPIYNKIHENVTPTSDGETLNNWMQHYYKDILFETGKAYF